MRILVVGGGTGLIAPDGTVLHVQEDMRTGGQDRPATLGMQRSMLQRILSDAVRDCGARVRLDCTVTALAQDASGVDMRFSDGGSSSRYDLVIGADGLHSAVRSLIGIDDQPAGLAAVT
jgi:2-polyprenyl-6-methoxyphenol hydroxylase-like FAD-dependent oxidoreductase